MVEIESGLSASDKIQAKALWDTGATCSVITNNLALKLKLIPFKQITISTPSGQAVSNVYRVNLYLPNRVKIENINVASGVPNNCDILIGMDIISRGDFAVSSGNGYTVFSFRMPSMAEIDFCKNSYITPFISEQTQGRNSPCKCGSGKKYKHCCGNK